VVSARDGGSVNAAAVVRFGSTKVKGFMNMNDSKIKPLPFLPALLFFGIPSVVAGIIVWVVMPWLNYRGLPFFFNYVVVYATLPMLALIVASLIAYQQEGRVLVWSEIRSRFRFNQMNGRAWLWAIGLTLFMFLTAGSLSFAARWIASNVVAPPSYWPPELNPTASAASANASIPTEFMGISLAGNWWIFIILLGSLVIATLGEEFWWRGYILPRQELVYGKPTWIVHGVLWAYFHLFAPWNFLGILPGCLRLAYVAQRLTNTWVATIAHGLANGLLVLIVVAVGIAR
jgi:membrane protease YdiL (CAAX protease family)